MHYVEVTSYDPARLEEAHADADACGAVLIDRRRRVEGRAVGIFGFTEEAGAEEFASAVAGEGEAREARLLVPLA